jgi:hypothetical protein
MPSESTLDALAAELMGEAPEPQASESPPVEEQAPDAQPDQTEATAESADAVEEQSSNPEEPADKALTDAFYAQKLPKSELTYGEFKDRAKDLAKADELRRTLENERLTFKHQLQQLQAAGMVKELPPEMAAQVEQQQQQAQAVQQQLILDTIPDWQNQATLMADAEEIAGSFAQYGFGKQEIFGFLQQDARFAKREYDRLLSQRALDAAKEKVAKAQRKAQSPTRAISRDAKGRFDAIANDSNASKDDRALAALLGGMSNVNN